MNWKLGEFYRRTGRSVRFIGQGVTWPYRFIGQKSDLSVSVGDTWPVGGSVPINRYFDRFIEHRGSINMSFQLIFPILFPPIYICVWRAPVAFFEWKGSSGGVGVVVESGAPRFGAGMVSSSVGKSVFGVF